MPFPEEPEVSVPVNVLKAEAVPKQWWDSCAHLLVPLNACRLETKFLPWKCQHERHAYEKCQFKGFMRRVKRAQDAAAEPADQ